MDSNCLKFNLTDVAKNARQQMVEVKSLNSLVIEHLYFSFVQ